MSIELSHAVAVCVALTLSAPNFSGALAGAQSASQTEATAAFLFAYEVKEGQRGLFEEGYRRHLDWHRRKEDPLLWYAWDVASGERTGLFIDGTFGRPFGAFDQRVDPAGDGADFAQTAAPFATTAFRSFYRLRPDLSTGKPLEERRPSPQVDVVHYVLHAGMEGRFERVLAELREALAAGEEKPVYTWYELVTGGESPGYMLMIPRRSWAELDTNWQTITAVISESHGPEEAAEILDELTRAVRYVRRETWAYRQDLSNLP